MVANFDDHGFLLSVDARIETRDAKLRAAFSPENWIDGLRRTLATADSLGRMFRRLAEIGQLLPRRTLHGNVSVRMASWNGDLLYKALLEYKPDHPLVPKHPRGAGRSMRRATRPRRITTDS